MGAQGQEQHLVSSPVQTRYRSARSLSTGFGRLSLRDYCGSSSEVTYDPAFVFDRRRRAASQPRCTVGRVRRTICAKKRATEERCPTNAIPAVGHLAARAADRAECRVRRPRRRSHERRLRGQTTRLHVRARSQSERRAAGGQDRGAGGGGSRADHLLRHVGDRGDLPRPAEGRRSHRGGQSVVRPHVAVGNAGSGAIGLFRRSRGCGERRRRRTRDGVGHEKLWGWRSFRIRCCGWWTSRRWPAWLPRMARS
jgi:hypothetical protein